MGLDIYLGDDLEALDNEPKFWMHSAYLRSSYNEYGFNSVGPVLTGNPEATFDAIFSEVLDTAVEKEGVYWLGAYSLDALRRAKDKAIDVAEKIDATEPFMVETIDFATVDSTLNLQMMDISKLPSHDAAVNLYLQERERHGEQHGEQDGELQFSSYRRGHNHFFHEGLEIVAAFKTLYYGYPAVSLVYKQTDQWKQEYVQAANAAARFIARAMSIIQTNKEVELVWSS